MEDDKPYSTDKYGRPDDKNYHYRIPLDGSAKRALRKVRVAEKVKGRWIETETSASRDGIIGYRHVETKDNKGPIAGLDGKYRFSKEWEYPFGPGRRGQLRARPNLQKGGGTKIKGPVGGTDLFVDFTSELTMSQLEHMDDDAYNILAREMDWALEDARRKKQEAIAEQRSNCDHQHFVELDEPSWGEMGKISGYCEDCGHEELAEV